MATRRRIASLFVILLCLSSALLSGDAIPQGYHARHTRSHKCSTCPPDCPEKLAGGQVHVVQYTVPAQPAQPQYAAPAQPAQPQCAAPAIVVQSSHSPPPSPSVAYVIPPAQPQVQYSAPQPQVQYSAPPAQAYRPVEPVYEPPIQYLPQPSPPCNWHYNEPPDNYYPCDYPGSEYDWAGSCSCGRSLDDDDDEYAVFRKYKRRSLDADCPDSSSPKEQQQPLPFTDESSPPADFYKNYKPYVRDSDRYPDDDSEEQPSRHSSGGERERLFVVYRADEFEDKPSDSELESVIRQAIDVARQQKMQENFALNGRKAKPARYRYEHEKRQSNEKVDFQPLKGEANADKPPEAERFNLSPGPLMKVGDAYVTEEGDDALNPGLDQSKWTSVPSNSHLGLSSNSPQLESVDEIEAAVSVVPKSPKMKVIRVPKIAEATNVTEKLKKDTVSIIRAEDMEKKNEKMAELIEDMPAPSTYTESTNFEKPPENTMTSASSTTNVPIQ